ncbi:MAG: hypothetical protein JWN15_150 [Firmicutes bacterium]|nr:hypothetical protein [Bacillota bacterium]
MDTIARRLGLVGLVLILVAGSAGAPSRAVSPAEPGAAGTPPVSAVSPALPVDAPRSPVDAPRSPMGTAIAYGTTYEPLRPGSRLTYRLADGGSFNREVMLPVTIPWFDGTLREVIPVFDSRYGGCFLYRRQGEEIQVIGTWRDGQLSRWGEYIVALGQEALAADPVETPSQRFDAVRQVTAEGGRAWYAAGVGLVKTEEFALTGHDQVEPRHSGL